VGDHVLSSQLSIGNVNTASLLAPRRIALIHCRAHIVTARLRNQSNVTDMCKILKCHSLCWTGTITPSLVCPLSHSHTITQLYQVVGDQIDARGTLVPRQRWCALHRNTAAEFVSMFAVMHYIDNSLRCQVSTKSRCWYCNTVQMQFTFDRVELLYIMPRSSIANLLRQSLTDQCCCDTAIRAELWLNRCNLPVN